METETTQTETTQTETTQTETTQTPVPVQMKLVDVQVTDENIAFNLLVSFISLAHKRGVFTLDESAKIWECISKFNKPAV
jgi:hypothetical protein